MAAGRASGDVFGFVRRRSFRFPHAFLVSVTVENKVSESLCAIHGQFGVVLRCPIANCVSIAHLVPHAGQTVDYACQARQYLAKNFIDVFSGRVKVKQCLDALVELNQVSVVLLRGWYQLHFNFRQHRLHQRACIGNRTAKITLVYLLVALANLFLDEDMVDLLGLRERRIKLHDHPPGLSHFEMVAVADKFVAIELEELVKVRRRDLGVEVFANPLPRVEDLVDEFAQGRRFVKRQQFLLGVFPA